VYVFSGRTGNLLHALPSPHEEWNGYFGQAVASVEDVDGGGRGGFLVGAWGEDPGTSPDDAGRAYLFALAEEVTATEEGPPISFVLHAPQPNPFATRASVRYDLPAASFVRLSVHDVLGREIAVLVDREAPAGRHAAVLDGARLTAGTYLLRLEANGEVATQHLALVR
jgi:hypothetical protein